MFSEKAACGRTELRWKQVRSLRGPATVIKELCSLSHCIHTCSDRQGVWEGERSVDFKPGNMHETDFDSQASEKRRVEFLFAEDSENGLWQGGQNVLAAFARPFLLPQAKVKKFLQSSEGAAATHYL